MFTGLVQTTASLARTERRGPEARLVLSLEAGELELGESISVAGVCLTVAALTEGGFVADVSAETLAVTTLGKLCPGAAVNIERSCRLGDRLGGHLVMGHVDGMGRVERVEPVQHARRVYISAPAALARYLAPKGSVAVDGVSLTINGLFPEGSAQAAGFEVMLVPHTLQITTLDSLRPGRDVNIEVDVMARYVARQLEHAGVTRADPLRGALERGGLLR